MHVSPWRHKYLCDFDDNKKRSCPPRKAQIIGTFAFWNNCTYLFSKGTKISSCLVLKISNPIRFLSIGNMFILYGSCYPWAICLSIMGVVLHWQYVYPLWELLSMGNINPIWELLSIGNIFIRYGSCYPLAICLSVKGVVIHW